MEFTIDQWMDAWQARGAAEAAARLESGGPPAEVAQTYDAWMREAYWKRKRIDVAVALAEAGIAFCRQQASLSEVADARVRFALQAKALAYNLGSFTWPGWDEPGIVLSPALLAEGLAAARLNLALALELNKPAEKVRNAYWLLGAHLLAAAHEGHLTEARAAFQLALPAESAAGFEREMVTGYLFLVQVLQAVPGAAAELEGHITSLQAHAETDARFFGDQLRTAWRVFGSARGM